MEHFKCITKSNLALFSRKTSLKNAYRANVMLRGAVNQSARASQELEGDDRGTWNSQPVDFSPLT